MRNGNEGTPFVTLSSLLPFYPTYEEWKPSKLIEEVILWVSFLSYLWGMETPKDKRNSKDLWHLFILPMRNGNQAYFENKEVVYNFLSYLWGMETSNGAKGIKKRWILFILPMRNGNKPEWFIGWLLSFSFYPTYEEWKLVFISPRIIFP